MALDYFVFYEGDEVELQAILDNFLEKEKPEKLFTYIDVRIAKKSWNEILNEEGYQGKYPSLVFININKDYAVEATNTLEIFRDKYLKKEKSIFLLNGDTPLSD